MPCGTGDELAHEVIEVWKVIRALGLPNRTASMLTKTEGKWDEVMRVVKDAILVLANRGIRIEIIQTFYIPPGLST